MNNAPLNAAGRLTPASCIPENDSTSTIGAIHIPDCQVPDGDLSNIFTEEDWRLGLPEVLGIKDTFGGSGGALKKHLGSEPNRENLAFVWRFRGIGIVGAGVDVDMPRIRQVAFLANQQGEGNGFIRFPSGTSTGGCVDTVDCIYVNMRLCVTYIVEGQYK